MRCPPSILLLVASCVCFASPNDATLSKTSSQYKTLASKSGSSARPSAPSPSPSKSPSSSPSSKSPSPAPSYLKPSLPSVSAPSAPSRISASKYSQPAKPVIWNSAPTTPYTSSRLGRSNLPWFLLIGGVGAASLTSCGLGNYLYANRCRSHRVDHSLLK